MGEINFTLSGNYRIMLSRSGHGLINMIRLIGTADSHVVPDNDY